MDLLQHLPQLLLGWSIILVAVASPAPWMRQPQGSRQLPGRAPAMALVVGIGCSSLLWSLITALGLSALFAQFADLILVVRILGAGFMAWLAYRAFRNALAPPDLTPRHAGVERALRVMR